MTLYLKYRPQKLEELDLTSVRENLTNILASKSIPHAFLFSGPKGSGKTSAARILAKVINCSANVKNKPCNKCAHCKAITAGNHLDVIEMDAASNRGIDDVRSLRENVNLAPSSANKKIYIIDEAHMLTTEAANALLKTLEEPPAHVMFILATTEPMKLPDTVRSRATTVIFPKASEEEIARQIARVVKSEKINIDKEAIEIIARYSEGSFREAVKILEGLAVDKRKITVKKAEGYLLQNRPKNIASLFKLIFQKDAKLILAEVEREISIGTSAKSILEELIIYVRSELLDKYKGEKGSLTSPEEELIFLLDLLLASRDQLAPPAVSQLPLELALIKWCGHSQEISEDEEEKEIESEPVLDPKKIKKLDDKIWSEIIGSVKDKNISIEALLRAARPLGFDGQTINVGVYYQFHKERLEAMENLKILEGVIAGVMGVPVRVKCTLTEREVEPKVKEETSLTDTDDGDILEAAKEIFGDV
ncbi:MAG: polymerase III, tau subunit protein [Candidatus Woesebacteria bacterium GW2011_GWB1_43_14]|uniref:DNA polymerase III subunit gamma/tau n=1 Tax=Candidatus Woesebacteria bacterium GW2011_GWB1_43_14 TaxID=1618578 RepID=A0A0G1DGY3_9BACT|nr:MAG: polymerase III, tau subunit protein [Candidatus Woesebacteria bacterium GW2011_GWA1_39_11b]KKS77733.1 MAG: polymerase III, subunit gamma and tau, DNA polymerase III subunit gamma/tau protein [Candidatus Woesebacteria bacterium GW2011_GWC1_42_9]KKS96959.1 MAG: polymerase III, tau subunit protein [Candidatus Woesebacteria bacterium GW2011_GWB1_43_14]